MIYRQILQQKPDEPEALNLLGVIALQVGRPDAAVPFLVRSVQIAPGSTLLTSIPAPASSAYGRSPILRTAAPSTNGSKVSSRTGAPATSAAVSDAAPTGSTAAIRTSGARSRK